MIRVLFFIHDLGGGGAEKVLVNLANNMDKSRFNVTVQTMFDNGVNRYILKDNITYKYIFKRVFRGNQHILKMFSPKFLYNMMVNNEYDVVVSYMQGATTRIVSGCNNNNVVLINWIHNEMSKNMLAHSYRSYNEFVQLYNKFDATIFVAETAREIFELETDLRGNNIVRYNTVESEQIIEKSEELIEDTSYNENLINLITVGNLSNQKGYDRLLRIIDKLVLEAYQIHLYILGKGILEKALKKYVELQGLSKHVTFLGYKDNPYKYVKNADLFVCSSYHEGYSTVVTESLIVGTPVLTTLCSGMREMLGSNNEYGIIVDNNEESLYEGLKRILSDKILLDHYKKRALERSSYFSKNRTVAEVEDTLMELFKKKSY